YLLFSFTHITTALTITKDQIAGLGKGSIDLGNNAPQNYQKLSFNLASIDCNFTMLVLIDGEINSQNEIFVAHK
ncbi:hypothetical protein ACFFUO_07095, partial [Vibrio artabrorum]|uniref:hypothetical protein n=1 Tax=Vibrio artabrorum TaxID=446374 RepID=UPI0035EA23ED